MHTGIILKRYFPYKQKIVLLDDKLGKITAVPPSDEISLATLMQYELRSQGTMPFMYHVELIAWPLDGLEHDILFVHHVLEMCYYFIPVSSASEEIFDLLLLLYTRNTCIRHRLFKKIFLFKLFVLLGIYPEKGVSMDALIHQLLVQPLEITMQSDATYELEQRLTRWLRECVIMHPCIEYFKTIHFLNESNRI